MTPRSGRLRSAILAAGGQPRATQECFDGDEASRRCRLLVLIGAACRTKPAGETPSRQPDAPDTPIGLIVRRHALQRSLEECRASATSDADCTASLAKDRAHLRDVNERLQALLKDPRTNMCDLVRWSGACNDPLDTHGDLADYLQASADRGEALNSGRFTLQLDPHGCPTDRT